MHFGGAIRGVCHQLHTRRWAGRATDALGPVHGAASLTKAATTAARGTSTQPPSMIIGVGLEGGLPLEKRMAQPKPMAAKKEEG